MLNCDHILPFLDGGCTGKKYNPCLLPQGHTGGHIYMRPDGVFIGWNYDERCGCPPEDDPCECYYHGEEPAEEVGKLLQGVPYLVGPLIIESLKEEFSTYVENQLEFFF